MINEPELKKYLDMDKTLLIVAFVQLEEKHRGLQANFDRLLAERNKLLEQVYKIRMPEDKPDEKKEDKPIVPERFSQQPRPPQVQRPQPRPMPLQPQRPSPVNPNLRGNLPNPNP